MSTKTNSKEQWLNFSMHGGKRWPWAEHDQHFPSVVRKILNFNGFIILKACIIFGNILAFVTVSCMQTYSCVAGYRAFAGSGSLAGTGAARSDGNNFASHNLEEVPLLSVGRNSLM